MAGLPETLARGTHADLEGRAHEVWFHRVGLLALAGFLAAGLAGVFGQSGETTTASAPAAALRVDAPAQLRSGLMYQARFGIEARATLERPTLVLEDGWFDGTTVNSLDPAPVEEVERNGYLVLVYDRLDAGDTLTVWIQLQVDPTSFGSRGQDVVLEDDGREVARVERSLTVFP